MLWPRSCWSLSAMRPPCVRLVSAVAAPPNLVRHVSAKCPPCVRCGRASKPCAACVRHVSAKCPPCVRLGRASKPCPAWARHVSTLCPPYVCFGFPSKPRPPCVGLALYPPCVSLSRASKRCVSHVALCVRHVSAPFSLFSRCPLVTLFALYPLFVGFWPGLWFGSALCLFFGFCAFVCSVSIVVHLTWGSCGCAFARCSSGHL